MKVAFNARTLSAQKIRGWSRYFSNLLRELSCLDVELYLFTDRPLNEALLQGCLKENVKVIVKRGFFYFDWEQRVLPTLCKEYEIDILHCPINYGLPFFKTCKQVLTLHDAIDKAFYEPMMSFSEKWGQQALYMKLLNKIAQYSSDQVIAVSEHGKKDLSQYYGISKERIKAIYEGADPVFYEQKIMDFNELKGKFSLKKDYLFYVGGYEERKNLDFLIQSLAQMDQSPPLVIAGGGAEIKKYQSLVAQLGMSSQIRFLGWVEDKDLPSLYKHARALIYPSLYEGFGLQIVEAMAMDCPVICSDRTSLPEVWGFIESCFNPEDSRELISVVERVYKDEEFYSKMLQWTSSRKELFSWKKTAEQTFELYKSLIDS